MAENTTTMKALEIEGGDDLMDTTANPMIVAPDADDDSSTDSSEEGEAPNTMSSASAEFKKRISCRKLFGCRGVVYLTLLLIVAGLHVGLLFGYTHNGFRPFVYWNRPFVWVFLVLACLFLIIFVNAILPCQWKKAAIKFYNNVNGMRTAIQKSARKSVVVNAYYKYLNTLGLNGKFYLWRLHAFEFMENYMSAYNMANIYLCSLPHWAGLVLMVVLIAESSYRAYSMVGYLWRGKSVSKRNRDLQITVDIVVDMIFLIFPLLITYLYVVPLTIEENILIVLFPSMSLLGKLRKMVNETVEDHADQIAMEIETELSERFGRRRVSIFGNSRTEQVERIQDKYFPRWAKLGVLSLSLMYVCVLLVIGIVQVASVWQLENKCECYVNRKCGGPRDVHSNTSNTSLESHPAPKDLFSRGCQVKIPFCTNLLTPTCNCAVFELKDHPIPSLSKDFVQLEGLRKVVLRSGPLKELPRDMERLNKMTYFDLSFNRLKTFDVDVEKWDKLIDLRIGYNNITNVHPNLWRHETLVNLFANSNVGLQLPNKEGGMFLPNLFYLNLINNSGLLPNRLGAEELPQIGSLYLTENELREVGKLPDGFNRMNLSLRNLGIARLGLTALPEMLTAFSVLQYMDARDNNLTNISQTMTDFIARQQNTVGIELYLSGNHGCSSGSINLPSCKPICSRYCYSDTFVGDGVFCDDSCNSISCNFDGMDCS